VQIDASFKLIAGSIALGIEGAAVVLVAYGAVEAIVGCILVVIHQRTSPGERKEVWLRFGVWLLLGLEFQLAADVVRTAVSPTWQELGQLAAIAAIRTFLNLFLQHDLQGREIRKE
jgi:uncharacterized membrane protein